MSRLNYPWKAWRPPEDNAQIGFAPLQDEIPLTQRSTATSYIELDRLGSFGGTRQRKGQPTVTQLPNHTKGDETPKVIYSTRRRSSSLALSSLVHIPPLLITVSILALNFRYVYWSDLGGSGQNLILDSLQYAAKAHELMMAFSFGAIVLHRVQASLISSEGIPLGLITAPYRITDAYYLLSKEFWGGATASQSKGPDTRSQTKPFRWVFLALLIAVTVRCSTMIACIH